jgi:hypothetical protein
MRFSTVAPSVLYHYTSQQGFVGIAATRSIWATDIRYMNDGAELRQAIDVTREYIEYRLRDSTSTVYSEVCAKIISYLDTAWESEIFAISLTAEGDFLSQWRAYSGSGEGYSIGFETAGLQALVEPLRDALLEPCVYAIEEQQRSVEGALHHIFDFLPQAGTVDCGQIVARCFSSFFTAFSRYAPLFKHPSFAEEREWRIVLPGLPPEGRSAIQYRFGRGTLVPYRVIPLVCSAGTTPMVNFIIGPTPFPELALRSTTQFLSQQKIQFKAVQLSQSPYRDW